MIFAYCVESTLANPVILDLHKHVRMRLQLQEQPSESCEHVWMSIGLQKRPCTCTMFAVRCRPPAESLKPALLRLVCKDVFELAAVDEASLDVAGGVGEAHGVAAQGLEPAVDGFGGSVA